MITRISVKVAEEWVFSKPFKHLIDEWEMEVIFPGSLVEHPVIDAHPPTSNCHMRYEFISPILDYYHATFLWNYLNWADPLSCTGRWCSHAVAWVSLFFYYLPHHIVCREVWFHLLRLIGQHTLMQDFSIRLIGPSWKTGRGCLSNNWRRLTPSSFWILLEGAQPTCFSKHLNLPVSACPRDQEGHS